MCDIVINIKVLKDFFSTIILFSSPSLKRHVQPLNGL